MARIVSALLLVLGISASSAHAERVLVLEGLLKWCAKSGADVSKEREVADYALCYIYFVGFSDGLLIQPNDRRIICVPETVDWHDEIKRFVIAYGRQTESFQSQARLYVLRFLATRFPCKR
jgi:hypothetical protein